MKLEGKVTIITWSSRGTGKQVALTFAEQGANIAVVARGEKEGTRKLPGTIRRTIEEIRALGGTAIPVRTEIVQKSVGSICMTSIATNRKGIF